MAFGQTPLQMSIVATADVDEYSAVTFAGAMAGTGVSNAGERIIGFADHAAKLGQAIRINYACTSVAVSGAAIDGTEPRLKTAASGRLIPWTSGSIVAAILMSGETAVGAGEKVRVFVMAGQN